MLCEGHFLSPEVELPKDSPLYQEIMDILRSIRPILLAYEGFKHAESIYFRFILCEKQGDVIAGASTLDSRTLLESAAVFLSSFRIQLSSPLSAGESALSA